MNFHFLLSLVGVLVFAGAASAQFVEIAPGVSLLSRSDPGPNRIRALKVDLCQPGVRMRATQSADRGQRTSVWASTQGAIAAINGGFFRGGFAPDQGVAAGGGALWADSQNQAPRGYFAFAEHRVQHFPSGDTAPAVSWIEEGVNGDATLVVNGSAVDCGGCGSNARAPRSALGYTAQKELLMVTVDGRSTSSRGMTIDELALLMESLGAERAMNLDGGGSTTLYVQGQGVVNVPSDGSERTVSNHLGVFIEDDEGAAYNCPQVQPRGHLDVVSCAGVSGWAQDLDTPDAPIDVHMYVGGPAGSGAYGVATGADRYREDLCSAIGSCEHGFGFALPLSFHDGEERPVHVYGINDGPLGNVELQNSPMMMQCDLPTPPYAFLDHVKRRISDEGFAAFGFARIDVAPRGIAPDYEPASLWPQELRLVKTAENATVYLVDDEVLRPFVSTEHVEGFGGSVGEAEVIDALEFAAFTLGPAMVESAFLMAGANGTFVIDVPVNRDLGTDAGVEVPDVVEAAADAASGDDAAFADAQGIDVGRVDAGVEREGADAGLSDAEIVDEEAVYYATKTCGHLGVEGGSLLGLFAFLLLPLLMTRRDRSRAKIFAL